MKFKESISVILPAYNDEEIIQQSVEEVLTKLQRLFEDFELILIDDASTDSTKAIIQMLSQKYSQYITSIYHRKNTEFKSEQRN